MTREQPEMVAPLFFRLVSFLYQDVGNYSWSSRKEDKLSLGRKKLEFLSGIFGKKKTLSFNFAFRCS